MKKISGFTLIEIIVVISIIAILVALLVPNFISARERAADSKIKSKLTQFKAALQMYYNDYEKYPDTGGPAIAISITGPGSKYMTQTMSELKYYNRLLTVNNNGGLIFDAVVACSPLQNTGDKEIAESQSKCFSGPPDASLRAALESYDCPVANCYCVCTL